MCFQDLHRSLRRYLYRLPFRFPIKVATTAAIKAIESESALRELRKQVTFAIFAETDDLDRVTAMVDELFNLLEKADRI
jgi:hypothetical protein